MKLDQKPWRLGLLAAGGILTGLCLVFPVLGVLEWVSMIPAGLVILRLLADPSVRLRRIYGYGLFFFMSFYLTVFHWFLSMYPLEFAGATKGEAAVVVLVAWMGLSLVQAVGGAFIFVLGGFLFRSSLAERYPILRPFGFGVIWAVYEWTQNFGWWGVPWGRLPLGQSGFLVGMQTASLFGSYFITFLLVSVNLLLAYIFLEAWKRKGASLRDLVPRGAILAVVLMLVFQYGAGAVLYLREPAESESRTLRVAAVQGNISSKWKDPDATAKARRIYGDGTRKAAEQGARLVVWPETAATSVIVEHADNGWYEFCSQLAVETNTTILVGGFTPAPEKEYNSVLCFLPDGSLHETVYHKRKLVPFGEFVPMGELIETLIPPLAELVLSGADLEQGNEPNTVTLKEGCVGSLICFDSIYDRFTRSSVLEGAELLCLSTNDSWFGDSRALYMHNAQAKLRAVESGRSVIRSANTGLTTLIDEKGRTVEEIPIQKEGLLVVDAVLSSEMTLYTRIGNLFVFVGIGSLGAWMIWELFREIHKKFKKTLDKPVEK
ncbi:MAG: apolipoprotein N-acyltransferase [Clostridia bacterium]|nr:apolipoprotein N-acyltransferase [Clostridia bacterium]